LLYVLYGEDDYSLRQEMASIKKELGADETLSANTTVLDGGQLTLERLKVSCETVPFLAEKRLVIVDGLLEKFEARSNNPRKKKATPSERESVFESLVGCLNNVPEFTVGVLTGGKISGQNRLLKRLTGATVKVFPVLKGASLQEWVRKRIRQAGGSISPKAVELLARFVGNNLWVMANEVDKLLLFKSGQMIEEEDVRAVVSYAQEANIFAMVDAIIEVRTATAQQLLQKLLRQGAAPAYLLVMVLRQLEIIVRVKEMLRQKKSRAEIQSRLGLTSDYVLRKAADQAGRYSAERLREVYHRLLEADISLKTGRFEGELVLDLLVIELCREGVGAGRGNQQRG